MAFTLELSKIAECDPCSVAHFAKKAKGLSSISYPDGWQASDTERVAKENGVALLWLVSKQLIPVTFSEANAAINKALGKDAAEKVREAFAAGPQKP